MRVALFDVSNTQEAEERINNFLSSQRGKVTEIRSTKKYIAIWYKTEEDILISDPPRLSVSSIEILELSPYVLQRLKGIKLLTIEQLCSTTEAELTLKGFTRDNIEEIQDRLRRFRCSLSH